MIENIEALIVLAREGTMTRTATRMRITQSAVSKRLAALEAEVGEPLVEKKGRGVTLTRAGRRLAAEAQPVLNELRNLLAVRPSGGRLDIAIGVSESVFGSWGAGVLREAERRTPGVRLIPHTHLSPAVVDRVRSGEYLLGLCSGLEKPPAGLVGEIVFREEMVLIQNKKPTEDAAQTEIWSIEQSSLTWRAMKPAATKLGIRPSRTLETFFGVAQAANAGFGAGLVPIGVAGAMRISKERIHRLDPPIERPIAIVAQKTVYNRPQMKSLVNKLITGIAKLDFA